MRHIDASETCPCGTRLAYGRCCGPIHENGAGLGTTATQLMRARYSAYALERGDFIVDSWHADTRPPTVVFSTDISWHELIVVESSGGGALDSAGTVEFRARFERGGERLELHELSRFKRVGGRWQYIDGVDPDTVQ